MDIDTRGILQKQYERTKPVRAFQLPWGCERKGIDQVYAILRDFEKWASQCGLLGVNACPFSDKETAYWSLEEHFRTELYQIEIIVKKDCEHTEMIAKPNDWVIYEYKKCFSVFTDDEFKKQYKQKR